MDYRERQIAIDQTWPAGALLKKEIEYLEGAVENPVRPFVAILGGAMNEAKKDKIGYMPEERGMYQDLPLDRCLSYLGSLKGLNEAEVKQRAEGYLKRFDLAEHKHKKVKELSKGMQQKAQIIVTLLHRPELLIVDEPFSGLDPVNTQLVKDLLREQRDQGVTVVLCSHQMHLVEELCDRIVLIDYGKVMLYGTLEDIRKKFSGNDVLVKADRALKIGDGNHDFRLGFLAGLDQFRR